MAGRLEFGSGQPMGEIAKFEIGGKPVLGTEFLQVLSGDLHLNKLKRQLEDEDPTKIAILTHFCENNGPGRFMKILKEKEEKNGRISLLAILQEGNTFIGRGNNEVGKVGKFGQLKGRFAESFFADCLNFMFQNQGLRVLTPREVEEFLEPLPKPFRVDSVLLESGPTHTKIVGTGEYKAGKALHDRQRRSIFFELESQVKLHDFLLSEEGKKFWPHLAKNLPSGLPKRIEVVSKKNFRHLLVVTKGLIRGEQTLKLELEKENIQILEIPFTVGELDKMTLVLLRNYCRVRQIII